MVEKQVEKEQQLRKPLLIEVAGAMLQEEKEHAIQQGLLPNKPLQQGLHKRRLKYQSHLKKKVWKMILNQEYRLYNVLG